MRNAILGGLHVRRLCQDWIFDLIVAYVYLRVDQCRQGSLPKHVNKRAWWEMVVDNLWGGFRRWEFGVMVVRRWEHWGTRVGAMVEIAVEVRDRHGLGVWLVYVFGGGMVRTDASIQAVS